MKKHSEHEDTTVKYLLFRCAQLSYPFSAKKADLPFGMRILYHIERMFVNVLSEYMFDKLVK